jgi:hypothetical protein
MSGVLQVIDRLKHEMNVSLLTRPSLAPIYVGTAPPMVVRCITRRRGIS